MPAHAPAFCFHCNHKKHKALAAKKRKRRLKSVESIVPLRGSIVPLRDSFAKPTVRVEQPDADAAFAVKVVDPRTIDFGGQFTTRRLNQCDL